MNLTLIVLMTVAQLISLCALALRLRARTRQHENLIALTSRLQGDWLVELDDLRRDGSRTRLRIGTASLERHVRT